MGIQLWNRLSFRQARATMLVGVLLGLLFSGLQIVWDLVHEQRSIDSNVEQVLFVVRGSAEQAAYEFSTSQSDRVAAGLFEYRAIRMVILRADDGEKLAERSRPAVGTAWRDLSELLFGGDRRYRQDLTFGEAKRRVGTLEVVVDSALISESFLDRASLVVIGGLLRNGALAVLLTVIFYGMVTRPLRAVATGVAGVDPANPGAGQFPVPRGHDRNELGFLVKTINSLLRAFGQAIEHRRRAEERAQASERRLRAILDNVVDGIVTLDATGAVRSTNPAAERLFGLPESRLTGQALSRLLPNLVGNDPNAEKLNAFLHLVALDERGQAREVDGLRGSDAFFVVELGVSEVRLSGEQVFIAIMRDITERKKAEAQIRHMALHDSLTDLPNKTLFGDRLGHALVQADRYGTAAAVLLIDLDDFKEINDTLGHVIGDQLLREVAARLKNRLREADSIARFGGDEFALLLVGLTDPLGASDVAQRVIKELGQPFMVDGHKLFVTGSIGITSYPGDGEDAAALLRNADLALYKAKDEGRNTYAFFVSQMKADALRRKTVVEELRLAIDHGEFEAWFQPVIQLGDDGTEDICIGAESLVRWRQPQRGLVRPDDFIPLAESTGQILAIGEWMLAESCRQARRWIDSGLPPMTVAVNLAAAQFRQDDLVPMVLKHLGAAGIDPQRLILEVTESAAMQDMTKAVAKMHVLRELGIRFAIDDFGTGYSSLAYLRRFPVYKVKIDKAFIRDALADGGVIPRAVVTISESLELRVVAEGVETAEQLEFLRGIGCHEVQGYLYGRPMPATEFMEWAHAFDARNAKPPVE